MYKVHYTSEGNLEPKRWASLVRLLESSEAAQPPPLLVVPPSDGPDAELSLTRLHEAATPHVVALSSSRAQGLSDRNPGFLKEGPDRATRDPEARSWRDYEKAVLEACARQRTPASVTILRSCPILDTPDALAQSLSSRRIFTWLGYDPPLQFLDLDRLLEVLGALAKRERQRAPNTEGDPPPAVERYYLAPDDAIKLSAICQASGVRRLPVPGPIMSALCGRKRGAGAGRYLQRVFTVSNQRLLEALKIPSLGTTGEAIRQAEKPENASGPQDSTRAKARDAELNDSYGLDLKILNRARRWVLEPARRWWWRVDARGVESFPTTGPALLIGIHRGFLPLDAMMILHLVASEKGRILRTLIHPALVRLPFLSVFLPAIGGRIASKDNAERTLEKGHALAIYPEGADAAMALTKEAYPLRPFLSNDFARLSIRNGVPVVPVVAIGPAETLPIFARRSFRWWKKLSGWPTLPFGFLFPLGPPIPLPAKWHILFLDPINPEEIAGDDETSRAKELARRVRSVIDENLSDILARRKSVWRGSLQEPAKPGSDQGA